jgi:haloalkane dehalogenase
MRNETFNGTFPYEPHFKEINGFEMHYIDEGSGDPIVCLHGMPTWSYLYRKFIAGLSQEYRVVVPDQMGFGRSDVPQNKPYLLKQHLKNTKQLLNQLNLKKITLVFQDWGGPIGFGYAVDYPEKIERIVIMNTSIGVMKEGSKPWYLPLEKKGEYEKFIRDIAGLIKMGIFNKDKITPTLIKAYTEPFIHDISFIGAFAWPKDIPIGESHPSTSTMHHIRNNLHILNDKKKILIWGMKDPIFPKWMINWWNKIYPGIETHKIENASHFLQEDAPDQIISIILDFLNRE